MARFLKSVKPVGPGSGMAHTTMLQPSKLLTFAAIYVQGTDSPSTSLRRAHFNPRKRGRKAKTDAEKRGGKGCGNWPPMDILKERWMREIDEDVNDDSPPVDFVSSNAAADAEDEPQGEQEVLVSTAEQPCHSSVSLSPDTHCSNNSWPESFISFADYLTDATHDFASDNSPTSCYSFDSQQAFASPEMESFLKPDDFQTQHATSYLDHTFLYFPEDWS